MSKPAKKRYDDLVVGAGPAGLTTAQLLARFGRSVLLVDCEPSPGGGLRRFKRGDVFFDTGFHFTGSVYPGELFDHLLVLLGVREAVKITPYDVVCSHRFLFKKPQAEVDVPIGIERVCAHWQTLFPQEKDSITWYFQTLRSIADRTMGMKVGQPFSSFGMLDEDFISLRSVLDKKFRDPILKGTICSFSMCYGSPPSQVSFAAHARVAYGMHQSVGGIVGGGDGLALALVSAAEREGVEICCGCRLEGFRRIENGQPQEAVFENGQSVAFERCVLTLEPSRILSLLEPVRLTPAFRSRVNAFEPSVGFLVAFGVIEGDAPVSGFARSIYSEFPDTDFDVMMNPSTAGERPLVVIEVPGRKEVGTNCSFSALELSFAQDVVSWAHTRRGSRPDAYYAYKRERSEAIINRMKRFVGYADRVRVVETASMLTFSDYLHSSCGSAYGIMQRVGQYGLFGRLPGRNVYAAGQSALLPGVMGAMMSGIFVVRQMVGKERFDNRCMRGTLI